MSAVTDGWACPSAHYTADNRWHAVTDADGVNRSLLDVVLFGCPQCACPGAISPIAGSLRWNALRSDGAQALAGHRGGIVRSSYRTTGSRRLSPASPASPA